MIDHVSFSVKDYAASLRFYDTTLAHLGYTRVQDVNLPDVQYAGYGKDTPKFWISSLGQEDEKVGAARGFHLAFLAESVEQVQKWYQSCLESGAKDNGPPGVRPHYHPGYYGAFVIDINGWRIEACLHHYG